MSDLHLFRGNDPTSLNPDQRGPQLLVGENVTIGDDVEIGANVVLHNNVVIGDGVTIQDGVVLGKIGARRNDSVNTVAETDAPVVIEDGVIVCTGATIFSGVRARVNSILGDYCSIAEHVVIGEDSVVGWQCGLGVGVVIGQRVVMQPSVLLEPRTVVEDDVFIATAVIALGDNSMQRTDRAQRPKIIFRRACRVGAGALITADLEIGEESLVAAGSVVTKDVAPRSKVMGVPARVFGEVTDEELLHEWKAV